MGKNMAIQNQRVKYADSVISGEEVITGENIKSTADDVIDIKEEINGIDKFWNYYGEVDATNTENRETTLADVVDALLAITGITGKVASIKYTTYDGGGYSAAYLLCKVNKVQSNAGGMVYLIDLLDYNKLAKYSGSGQTTFKSQAFATFMTTYKYDLVAPNTDRTSKKILTWAANGNAPAWTDPESSGMDVVEITTSSGTLSASDLAKIGPNCLIKYTHTGTSEYLVLDEEDATYYKYSSLYLGNVGNSTDKLSIYEITVNKTSGGYSTKSDVSYFLKSSSGAVTDGTLGDVIGSTSSGYINKESASHFRIPSGGTTGQVLAKVDGTDYNIGWATPSGGGIGKTVTFDDYEYSDYSAVTVHTTNRQYIQPVSGGTYNDVAYLEIHFTDAVNDIFSVTDGVYIENCKGYSYYSFNGGSNLAYFYNDHQIQSGTLIIIPLTDLTRIRFTLD